jgi:hypothetical protein
MVAGAGLDGITNDYKAFRAAWKTGSAARSLLRGRVAEAGRGITTGAWEAHHIVPLSWPSEAAEAARVRLAQLHIDINEVSNGVGLETSVHRALDNNAWSSHVEQSLRAAQTRPQAIGILDDLAHQLVTDPTPWLRRR